VVAGLVFAVIGELDARAALLGAALGAHAPREDAPAHEREVVELALELVVEQIVVALTLRGRGRSAEDVKPRQSPSPRGRFRPWCRAGPSGSVRGPGRSSRPRPRPRS